MFSPTKTLTFVTSIYHVMNRPHKYKISFSSSLAINCLIWALVMKALKSHREFLIHHPLWISVLRKPMQVIISGYGCPLDIDPNLKFWASNVYETKYRSEICIKYNGFRTYSRIQVRDIRINSDKWSSFLPFGSSVISRCVLQQRKQWNGLSAMPTTKCPLMDR